MQISFQRKRIIYLLPFILLAIIYFIGLFIDVMDVDAAQYASMSREMLQYKNFLQPTDSLHNYLDKPPLLFWLSSLSFYVFGISNFAYKLPSFLFALLGIYSTFKLARLYYSSTIAYVSALVLASCQAFFLSTNDVRTDTLLMSSVIFAIWHLAAYIQTNKYSHFFLGFFGIALAMLSKGPIGIVIPAFAFSTDFILKRKWKLFFKWQWLLGIVFVLLLLSPMIYGLYQQWGEKGPKFFFWTQSFGRITGESEWKNDTTPFFFVHTIAWMFIPWSLFLFIGVYRHIASIIRSKERIAENDEAMSIGGFVLGFIALSLSQYKLPHYIFVLFPLAAIITARFLVQFSLMPSKWVNIVSGIQVFVLLFIWVVVICVATFVFPSHNVLIIIFTTLVQLVCLFIFFHDRVIIERIVAMGVATMFGVNFVLSTTVYPELLDYQADDDIGRYVAEHKIDPGRFFAYQKITHSLCFYSRQAVKGLWGPGNVDSVTNKFNTVWVVIERQQLEEVKKEYSDLHYKILVSRPDFPVANLNAKFLKRRTRPLATTTKFLMEISK